MNKLDAIRQKIENDRKQDEKRQQELAVLRDQISALDAEIDAAIDSDQAGTAEQLLNKQNELRNKLAIMERIGARKTAPDAYYDELLEIAGEYADEMQTKIDKAETEIQKAHRAYLEKKIALAKLLYEAATFRSECGKLAGIGSLWSNPRFDRFPYVKYYQNDLDSTNSETEIIIGMYPEYGVRFNEINSFVGFKP